MVDLIKLFVVYFQLYNCGPDIFIYILFGRGVDHSRKCWDIHHGNVYKKIIEMRGIAWKYWEMSFWDIGFFGTHCFLSDHVTSALYLRINLAKGIVFKYL